MAVLCRLVRHCPQALFHRCSRWSRLRCHPSRGESDRSYSAPFHLEERRIDKDVMHILRFGTDIDRTGICPSRQAERSGPLFAPNLLAFCAARVEHQSDLAICRGVGARLGHFQRCGE